MPPKKGGSKKHSKMPRKHYKHHEGAGFWDEVAQPFKIMYNGAKTAYDTVEPALKVAATLAPVAIALAGNDTVSHEKLGNILVGMGDHIDKLHRRLDALERKRRGGQYRIAGSDNAQFGAGYTIGASDDYEPQKVRKTSKKEMDGYNALSHWNEKEYEAERKKKFVSESKRKAGGKTYRGGGIVQDILGLI